MVIIASFFIRINICNIHIVLSTSLQVSMLYNTSALHKVCLQIRPVLGGTESQMKFSTGHNKKSLENQGISDVCDLIASHDSLIQPLSF
jgi:hypothetical protein